MAKRAKKKNRSRLSAPTRVEASMSGSRSFKLTWVVVLQALAITAAVVLIYWPCRHGGWIMDDNNYFVQNPLLNDPARLWKAWFVPGSFIEYYPLHQTVQWMQWQLWHDDTFGYHASNVVLHVLSSLLVWRVLHKLGLRLAWLGGLLFAVHPMQVETVAWMSELKNTLSLPPLLLALCAWVDYDAHGQRRDYFLALGFFVLALLVKTAVAPLPFVLLLYAWWKRGSVNWADAKGVAPFLFAALVLGWTSVVAGQDYAAQHPQLQETVTHGDFFTRLVIAGLSLWLYVGHALWPFDPLPAYPQWPVDPPTLPELFPWVALLGLLAWLWTERAGWGRHVLLGFGFFLLMLAPFLGFIWISYMDSTWVMDHFLYYPIIGLIGLAVAGLGQLQERLPSAGRWIGAGLLFVGFALLIGESRSYAALFASEEALMAHTVERNPDSWLARNNLGRARMLAGDLSGAIEQCDAALELKPDFVDARTNLGNAYLRGNRLPEAIAEYQQVIEINPTYVEAQSNLGVAYAHSGRLPEAIAQFRQTLQLDPDLALTHFALANALMRTGQVQEAIQHYEEAVRLSPDNPTWQEALDAARREAGGSP